MFNKIYNKYLPLLILIQPLFDCITSIMVHFNYNVTLGVILKVLILFLSVLYLLFFDKSNRKINIIMLSILFIFSIMNIICNKDIIELKLFEYTNYLFKYLYLVIMLYFFLRWTKNNENLNLSKLRIPMAIISIIFIAAFLTNTSFNSYSNNRRGICGWFNSANELGALVSLLYPISIYNAFHNSDKKKIDIVLFIMCSIMLILIGTKACFLSFILILLSYIIYRLLTLKKHKFNYQIVLVLLILVFPFFFFKEIPAVYNTKMKMEAKKIEKLNKESASTIILSGRDKFQKKVEDNRQNIDILSEFFGKSYLKKNGAILIVERDPLDIRYMYGIIGISIFIILLINIYYKVIKFFFKNFLNNFYDISIVMCLISISLTLVISYISGHVLLSPSVSTYLIFLISYLYKVCNRENCYQIEE